MSQDLIAGDEATLTGVGRPAAARKVELAAGSVLGRYVVLARLGAGAMGVVHAAYDPELDRKVALKLLHASARDDSDARARLLREAQALAKLSHPGIVTVHDVGTVGEQVWIAMEFVAGRTLREWSGERTRSCREVLEVMCAAGQGLAAAHAAGLVHRDFKPDNVMIDASGRVRVMDFGLARASDERDEPPEDEVSTRPRRRVLDEEVTRIGAITGTPAYMAPEQFAGGIADARSDQFAFCVTLWEALYGERPFGGATFAELSANVVNGKMSAPPQGVKIPSWLHRACTQGLERDREMRWSSIDALLDALQRGGARARRRRIIAGVLVPALAIAGIVGVRELNERRQRLACEREGESITESWNDGTRAQLEQALLATGVSYADTTAQRVTPWIDAQADKWRIARTEACVAGGVEAWSADTLERSLWCLDDRRMELDALVVELSHADADVVERAVTTAAAALSPIGHCQDVGLLERMPAPPPIEQREQVRAARAELSRAEALSRAGRHTEALAAAEQTVEHADGLDWPPLRAMARGIHARLLDDAVDYEQAEQVASEAYFTAGSVGAWSVAADAATLLIYVVGYERERHTEGLVWAEHAAMALRNAGDPDGLGEARRMNNIAGVRALAGDSAGAIEDAERVVAIWEHEVGPNHPRVASSLNNLANLYRSSGQSRHACELHERALAISEQAFGRDHPRVALSLNNLANAHRDLGALDVAATLLERALAIRESALGPRHPDVAQSLLNLCAVRFKMNDSTAARPLCERALPIWEHALGPEHPSVLLVVKQLAGIDFALRDYARARDEYGRLLTLRERLLGPNDPLVAAVLADLAATEVELGEQAGVTDRLERALRILDREPGMQAEEADARTTIANTYVKLAQRTP